MGQGKPYAAAGAANHSPSPAVRLSGVTLDADDGVVVDADRVTRCVGKGGVRPTVSMPIEASA